MSQFIFLVVLLVVSSVTAQTNNKDRYWHEDTFATSIDDLPPTYATQNPRILYPFPKLCVAPVTARKVKGSTRGNSFDGEWSELMSPWLFDLGFEIQNWQRLREVADATVDIVKATFLVLPMLGFYFMFFAATCLVVPLNGCILFRIFRFIWTLISHTSIRLILRRLWIADHKRKQRRIQFLYMWDKSKAPANRARIPRWLRKYKEEEIPQDVVHLHAEASDDGDSSDGFEVDYVAQTMEATQTDKEDEEEATDKPETEV